MMIYRTKLVAVLTIVFGMAIGGGLTFSFLALSGSEDVAIAPSATAESTHRLRFPTTFALTGGRMVDGEMIFTGEFKVPVDESQLRMAQLNLNILEQRAGEFRTCFRYDPPPRVTGLALLSYSVWLPSSRGLACL